MSSEGLLFLDCTQPVQPLAQRLATAAVRPWPDHPIPISLVITDLDVGGAEWVLTNLALKLDRRRWHPSVLALAPEGKLATTLREAGIDTECLGVNPRRPMQAVVRLAKALRQRKPWLVQSFLFHANLASRLAAPGAGCPWVVSGLRVAEREKSWHWKLDRATTLLSAGSVCVSQGVLRFTRDVAGIDPARLVVIPNAVDTTPFDVAEPASRASLGIPDEAQLALFVGRLEAQKAPFVLIEAAEVVAAQVPNWHLALAGDGHDREALQRRIGSSPLLADRVHLLGARTDVPSLLKAADLLVLPSLWEGMPNVVLEAMASRLAVVATAVEGTEDLVRAGETGWLVPPGSAPALAQALLEAASDRERRERFGRQGRARIEAEFTWEKLVESYESLWARVLGLAPSMARSQSSQAT